MKRAFLLVAIAIIIVSWHDTGYSLPFDPWFQKVGLGDFDQKKDSWGHYRGEPLVDTNANGKYDPGEDYHDLNSNGTWDSANIHHGYSPLWSNWSWDYCAPTSAANSIWYFSNHGWPNLWPTGSNNSDVITKLAEYMDTWNDFGTQDNKLVEGWEKYFGDYYKDWFFIKYETKPKLDWLKYEIFKCEDVLLGLTWYYWDDNKKDWVADGGHVVTLAGYGKDENGNLGPNYIKIHDPLLDTIDDYYLTNLWNGYLYIDHATEGRGVIDAAFSASPVPEPCTLLLLGSGLAGLVGFGRKRLLSKRKNV